MPIQPDRSTAGIDQVHRSIGDQGGNYGRTALVVGNPVEGIVIFLQLCVAADIIVHIAIVLHDSPRDFILCYFVVPIKEPKLVSSEEDTAH
jgi:hypothetical protein